MWHDYSKTTGSITLYKDYGDVLDAWNNLENKLTTSRFSIDTNMDIFKIIDTISDTHIDFNNIFYRGRINSSFVDNKGIKFTEKELRNPPPEKCGIGRLNPEGISYLYLSDSKETCIAELRPWIGSSVEVATFSPKSTLLLKDFTVKSSDNEYIQNVKEIFSLKFSKPVSVSNKSSEYRITQCLSEYIKLHCKNSHGKSYDGIKYKSSANESGYNIVLFNPSTAGLKAIIGRADISDIKVIF